MPTTLVTGCNRGLGLEFVRQYAADGWTVIATCRTPSAAGELSAIPGDVQIHSLDVADFAAIDALAQNLSETPIDVLILNAGINPQRGTDPRSGVDLATTDYDIWNDVLRVNVMAPARMAAAFRANLVAGERKVVVGLSSQAGSMGLNRKGNNYLYRTSKAGLNAVMVGLAGEFAEDGIIAASIIPGFTRTDMGGPDAPRSPEQSVGDMRRVIDGLTLEDTGRFIGFDGNDLPW